MEPRRRKEESSKTRSSSSQTHRPRSFRSVRPGRSWDLPRGALGTSASGCAVPCSQRLRGSERLWPILTQQPACISQKTLSQRRDFFLRPLPGSPTSDAGNASAKEGKASHWILWTLSLQRRAVCVCLNVCDRAGGPDSQGTAQTKRCSDSDLTSCSAQQQLDMLCNARHMSFLATSATKAC